jgi:HEAT repeat protein
MKRYAVVLGALVGLASVVRAEDVNSLVQQLKSPDVDQRRAAAKNLGAMGSEASSAVPALAAALKDKDLYVRRFAAQALGEVGGDAGVSVKALSEALRDPQKEVVEAAAAALGKLGEPAVATLAKVVGDKSKPTSARIKAAQSLGGMGKSAKEAVPALVAALQDREVRLEAVTSLGRIGSEAKGALKELEAMAARRDRDRVFMRALNDTIRKIKR